VFDLRYNNPSTRAELDLHNTHHNKYNNGRQASCYATDNLLSFTANSDTPLECQTLKTLSLFRSKKRKVFDGVQGISIAKEEVPNHSAARHSLPGAVRHEEAAVHAKSVRIQDMEPVVLSIFFFDCFTNYHAYC
jgi:hypothetical protein